MVAVLWFEEASADGRHTWSFDMPGWFGRVYYAGAGGSPEWCWHLYGLDGCELAGAASTAEECRKAVERLLESHQNAWPVGRDARMVGGGRAS